MEKSIYKSLILCANVRASLGILCLCQDSNYFSILSKTVSNARNWIYRQAKEGYIDVTGTDEDKGLWIQT